MSRQQSNTPRVRTRQGCWSCRRRRRKCDEDKPICQNCVRKGLRCEYGIQLTFHDANLLELDGEDAKELRERAPGRYERVQFVDGMRDNNEDYEQSYNNREETPPLVSNDIDSPINTNNQAIHTLNSVVTPYEESQFDNNNRDTPMGDISEVDNMIGRHMRVSSNTSVNFNTTTVVGLNQSESLNTNQGSFHSTDHQDDELSRGPSASYSLESQVTSHHIRSPSQARNHETTTTKSNYHMVYLSTNQNLLKYYIDHVAPWLEVNSVEALYSTHIPLISSKYDPLRQSIFALVAAQSRNFGSALGDSFFEASCRGLGSDMYSRHEEPILARQLLLITKLISLPIEEWHSVLKNEIPRFGELGIHGLLGGVRGSSSWLMLRFDIAVAFNSRQPLVTNLKYWQRGSSPSTQPTDSASNSTYLHDSLLLCAQVIHLWQSMNSKVDIDCWTQHLTKLETLKNEPLSELSIPILRSAIGNTKLAKSGILSSSYTIPASFPISIYTNRPFFYIQILNHLTYILLIQCKPRQVLSQSAKSLNTAPWHAVQLCGLALSNPVLWSWDPVVVASLLFAGSFLSYSEQQIELLKHLKLLRKTTGWKFDQEILNLEDFWKSGY